MLKDFPDEFKLALLDIIVKLGLEFHWKVSKQKLLSSILSYVQNHFALRMEPRLYQNTLSSIIVKLNYKVHIIVYLKL